MRDVVKEREEQLVAVSVAGLSGLRTQLCRCRAGRGRDRRRVEIERVEIQQNQTLDLRDSIEICRIERQFRDDWQSQGREIRVDGVERMLVPRAERKERGQVALSGQRFMQLVEAGGMTRHRRDDVGRLDAKTRTHGAATRESCHVDAVRISGQLLDDVIRDLTDELHVVSRPRRRCRVACGPLVRIDLERKAIVAPDGRETLVVQHKVFGGGWEDCDDAFLRGLFAPAGHAQELFAGPAPAMEHEHRGRIRRHAGERNPDDVSTGVTVNFHQPAVHTRHVRNAVDANAVAGNPERGHG